MRFAMTPGVVTSGSAVTVDRATVQCSTHPLSAHRLAPAVAAFIALAALAAPVCDSWYHKTMKKFGMEKRDTQTIGHVTIAVTLH
jgi:hypothetical protein